VECLICLVPLFTDQSKEEKAVDLLAEDKRKTNKFKSLAQSTYNIIFDFNEFSKKKPFILTPCQHAFHTHCLENWLKLKRECPTDRTPIPQSLN
jgi:hypothetical protein